jgi:hypothetical protein
MSMTKNAVKYALMFLGILILLIAYLFVYTDYTDKTEALGKEIATLNDRLSQLSGYHEKENAYKSSIEENKASINEMLGRYYSNETPEDFIMFATDMEATLDVDITAMSFSSRSPSI